MVECALTATCVDPSKVVSALPFTYVLVKYAQINLFAAGMRTQAVSIYSH